MFDENIVANKRFSSCYFGGGTPSILSLSQLERIRDVFDTRRISFDEVSIELHPESINWDVASSGFFNRFSIGVQSTRNDNLSQWIRPINTAHLVEDIVSKIRKCLPCATISLDFLFFEDIPDEDIDFVNSIQPDAVVFYPKTGPRSEREAAATFLSLEKLGSRLPGYYRRNGVAFHFFKEWRCHSKYADACYGFESDILGLGHNSVSRFGDMSFLSLFDESFNGWELKRRNRNVQFEAAWQSLLYGIPAKLQPLLPQSIQRLLISDKHFYSTHLPFDRKSWKVVFEQIRGFDCHTADFCRSCFFWSDGRDKDIDTVFDIYESLCRDWKNRQDSNSHPTIPLPQFSILIEGIDGCGKDTFAKMLFESLTMLFNQTNGRSISIVGLPSSESSYGRECKYFVEEGKTPFPRKQMASMLEQNRLESLDRIKTRHPGIQLFVRGEWTEHATMERFFGLKSKSSSCVGMDLIVFVKTRPDIARKRIEARGTRITWRESLQELMFFDDFYWNSFLRTRSVVLINNDSDSIHGLEAQSKQLAASIYRKFAKEGR